jgi:hypothetical protein
MSDNFDKIFQNLVQLLQVDEDRELLRKLRVRR